MNLIREKKFDPVFQTKVCGCNSCVRLIFLGCQMAEKSNFKIYFFPRFENSVFPKNGVLLDMGRQSPFQGRTTLVRCTFGLYIVNGRLVTLERESRKTDFQSDKSVFSGSSWPLTSFISRGCSGIWNRLIALMKLFSLGRIVLAILSKFGPAIALVKWQKDDDTAAHVRNGMVPGRSPDRRFCALRPEL